MPDENRDHPHLPFRTHLTKIISLIMAYNYTNPFVSSPVPSRSTFTATAGSSVGYQVLFSGLPTDVTEKDLRVSDSVG